MNGHYVTYSGAWFAPLQAEPQQVNILDIAHALSQQCRFGGHTLRFYSAAEHAYHLSMLVPLRHALHGLLFHAAEAYCFGRYHSALYPFQRILAQKFGLPAAPDPIVQAADDALIQAEMRELLLKKPAELAFDPSVLPEYVLPCWAPMTARDKFFKRFQELTWMGGKTA